MAMFAIFTSGGALTIAADEGVLVCDTKGTSIEDTSEKADEETNQVEEVVIVAEDVQDASGATRPRYTEVIRDAVKKEYAVEVHGYVNAGGQFNSHGVPYNLTGANSDHYLGLDAAYLSITKAAQTGDCVFDYGFGFDTMFGRDARLLRSKSGWDNAWSTGHSASNYNGYFGGNAMDSYGFAMPQLYGEVTLNHLTMKGGRFYTPFGCESARADSRFFYSLGRSFESAPITHTGVLFSWDRIENTKMTLGWVMGENTMFEQAEDIYGENYSESMILGSFQVTPHRLIDLKYNFESGTGVTQGLEGDQFRQEVIWQSQLSRKWSSTLLFGSGRFTRDRDPDSLPIYLEPVNGYSYSGDITAIMPLTFAEGMEYQTWAGHLYYTMNECWKFGGRAEFQHGNTVGENPYEADIDMDLFSLTFGANWTPMGAQGKDCLVVRPEIRYDHASDPVFGAQDDAMQIGDLTGHEDQLTLGCDVMFRF